MESRERESVPIASRAVGAGAVAHEPRGAGRGPVGSAQGATAPPAGDGRGVGRYRWTICALLFFATTINYIDRQVFGFLAPVIQGEVGWNEAEYGRIVSYFTLAYALGFLGVGRLFDRIGTRKGFSLAIVVWSIAAMAHGLARSVAGFSIARFALGLGRVGQLPRRDQDRRGVVPEEGARLRDGDLQRRLQRRRDPHADPRPGDRGAVGVARGVLRDRRARLRLARVLAAALPPPARAPAALAGELAYIESDPAESTAPVSWFTLLRRRQTWAFAIGKALTDPVWWFYLFWLPSSSTRASASSWPRWRCRSSRSTSWPTSGRCSAAGSRASSSSTAGR
jgi:ACS family hexuronate transporter-like MFS transporter